MVDLVKVGESIINVDAVAGCHWEKEKLFVHFVGGRFESLKGQSADGLWSLLQGRCLDLESGEGRR